MIVQPFLISLLVTSSPYRGCLAVPQIFLATLSCSIMEVQNKLAQLIQLYRFIAGYEEGDLKSLLCDITLDM